jgi:hypothetical protein
MLALPRKACFNRFHPTHPGITGATEGERAMKAMLIVQAENGYAMAPFTGELPADFVGSMRVESEISSYSYGDSVARALKNYFEPREDKPEVPAAPEVKHEAEEAPL